MRTFTIPAQAQLNNVTCKALHVTGRTVTVGGKIQGRVITIEGDTWTTVAQQDGSVTLDLESTLLPHHEDPSVYYVQTYQDEWTGEIREHHSWTVLSQVSRGVCLVK